MTEALQFLLNIPLPLTVTVGRLLEPVPEALASILAGVAAALVSAKDAAAAIANEPFIMIVTILLLIGVA